MLNDHIHILIEILPKYSVAQVIGYIKGKSALYRARRYGERQRYFTGQHMWARGYFVSTVGLDEEVIRKYIREQEKNDLRQGKSTFKPCHLHIIYDWVSPTFLGITFTFLMESFFIWK